MSKVLIIGCGGVANVAIRKCCQCDDLFTHICIASRTKSKCDALKADLEGKTKTQITTAQVNADDAAQVAALIREYQPDLVMNIALPYQDLAIMDACLECGVNYLDTANYEPEDLSDPAWRARYEKRCKEEGFSAYFDYSYQWDYKEKFEKAGLTALLGTGFDPGVTQALLRLCPEAPVRPDRHHRHPGLQRGRPRLSLRHQLQPRSEPARGVRPRLLLGGRPLGGDRAHVHPAGVRL